MRLPIVAAIGVPVHCFVQSHYGFFHPLPMRRPLAAREGNPSLMGRQHGSLHVCLFRIGLLDIISRQGAENVAGFAGLHGGRTGPKVLEHCSFLSRASCAAGLAAISALPTGLATQALNGQLWGPIFCRCGGKWPAWVAGIAGVASLGLFCTIGGWCSSAFETLILAIAPQSRL